MLMNLMKMKTEEKKRKRMKNNWNKTWKKIQFFYKCNVCDFETLFVDQFKQHNKWNHLKSKPKAKWKRAQALEKELCQSQQTGQTK